MLAQWKFLWIILEKVTKIFSLPVTIATSEPGAAAVATGITPAT
jgi:hypothetical protein